MKRMLLILIAALCLTSCGRYYSETEYNKLEEENKELQSKLTSKQHTIDGLNAEIDNLNDQIEDLKSGNDTRTATEVLQDILDSHETSDSNTSSASTHSGSTSSSYGKIAAADKEPTCLAPGCDNTPARNSYFCFRHECLDASCHNPKANDFTQYCIEHKCHYPDCNSGHQNGSYYCVLHSR